MPINGTWIVLSFKPGILPAKDKLFTRKRARESSKILNSRGPYLFNEKLTDGLP